MDALKDNELSFKSGSQENIAKHTNEPNYQINGTTKKEKKKRIRMLLFSQKELLHLHVYSLNMHTGTSSIARFLIQVTIC